MQHTTVFDTHAAVKRLTAAGVAEPQAEAIVATCGEAAMARLDALATKTDLAELRADLRAEDRNHLHALLQRRSRRSRRRHREGPRLPLVAFGRLTVRRGPPWRAKKGRL